MKGKKSARHKRAAHWSAAPIGSSLSAPPVLRQRYGRQSGRVIAEEGAGRKGGGGNEAGASGRVEAGAGAGRWSAAHLEPACLRQEESLGGRETVRVIGGHGVTVVFPLTDSLR